MPARDWLLLGCVLALASCAPAGGAAPASDVPPPVTPTPTVPALPAAEGWTAFISQELGFGFSYPDSGMLSADPAAGLAMIVFPAPPGTNVVEESLLVYGAQGAGECASPLAEGWTPEDLSPQMVDVHGIPFLRQTHAGAAAGTASTWVAYTTRRDDRCASLGYVLSTFDPANLDPTRFPTPPAAVDVQQRIRDFEAVAETFVWLR